MEIQWTYYELSAWNYDSSISVLSTQLNILALVSLIVYEAFKILVVGFRAQKVLCKFDLVNSRKEFGHDYFMELNGSGGEVEMKDCTETWQENSQSLKKYTFEF